MMSLTVIDQGASSLSNFGLSILVAHKSSAREFGIFALVTTTYVLAQGLVRSVSSDCLLTRSGESDELRGRLERTGYLFAILSACVLSVVVVPIGIAIGGTFDIPFLIFAASFPFLAMQDYARFIGIGRHDPGYAVKLDVAWIVLYAAAVIGLHADNLMTLPWLFGAWTASGAVVGLYTMPAFLSLRHIADDVRYWIRSEWNVGVQFAGQFVVRTFGVYGVVYLLVLVISLGAIGLVKNLQLAGAPLFVLFTGVQSALVAIISRKLRQDLRQTFRFLHITAAVMTLTMAVWAVLVYATPPHDVAKVLGHIWIQARPYALWMGAGAAFSVTASAYLVGLRAMRSAKDLLRLSIIMAPFQVIVPLIGAQLDGIRGLAVGTAIGGIVLAVTSWRYMVRAGARFEKERQAEEATAVTPISL
jgi:O-antigen/teichoic acid export membrane protein